MALLECPECKQEVAERDYFCIECGYPRSGMSANKSPARPDRSFEATHPRLATAAKNKRLEATAAAKQERLATEKKRLATAAKNKRLEAAAKNKRLEAAAAAKQERLAAEKKRLATAAKKKLRAAAAKQERRAEAAEKKLRAAAAKQDQAKDQDPVKIYDSKAPTENIADKVMTWGTAISIPVVLYLLYRVANWLLKALTGLELNPADLF